MNQLNLRGVCRHTCAGQGRHTLHQADCSTQTTPWLTTHVDPCVCMFACLDPSLQVKNIVVATGGQASRIPTPGAEHAIISDEVCQNMLHHTLMLHATHDADSVSIARPDRLFVVTHVSSGAQQELVCQQPPPKPKICRAQERVSTRSRTTFLCGVCPRLLIRSCRARACRCWSCRNSRLS